MKIIITDLDGTLLDDSYSPGPALSLISKIKDKIPIIFCSAKTFKEQKFFIDKFSISHPFIVEDGSAIYIPYLYFKKKIGKIRDGYEVVILGIKRKEIIRDIEILKLKRYKIKAFYNMSLDEISSVTFLNRNLAKLAKDREFSETIVEIDKQALKELRKKYNAVVGGKFIHIYSKNTHKGRAVKELIKLYKNYLDKNVITIGIGNSYTDEPMLKAVDIPVLVKNPDGKWARIDIEGIYKTQGIGPLGWCEAVEKFVL